MYWNIRTSKPKNLNYTNGITIYNEKIPSQTLRCQRFTMKVCKATNVAVGIIVSKLQVQNIKRILKKFFGTITKMGSLNYDTVLVYWSVLSKSYVGL